MKTLTITRNEKSTLAQMHMTHFAYFDSTNKKESSCLFDCYFGYSLERAKELFIAKLNNNGMAHILDNCVITYAND